MPLFRQNVFPAPFRLLSCLIAAAWLALPWTLMAASPEAGTDDFLRSAGWSHEQLSQKVTPEKRQVFDTAVGETEAKDPAGDVLSRLGVTAGIQVPWADATGARLTRDLEEQAWVFTLETAETISEVINLKANFLLYVDGDGNPDNNETEGVRAGMDREYSLAHNAAGGWYMDFRWYNADPAAATWANDRDTQASFEVSGTHVTIRVPFAELSEDAVPRWRMAAAVSDKTSTQVDVVPGVGFPPPPGESYPNPRFAIFPSASNGKNPWLAIAILGGVLAVVGGGYAAYVRWKS